MNTVLIDMVLMWLNAIGIVILVYPLPDKLSLLFLCISEHLYPAIKTLYFSPGLYCLL